MGPVRTPRSTAQAWIELVSADPEALSALDVARDQLAAARHLKGLRRIRLVELAGTIPARDRLEALLHGSTQFYNPHKERCAVRLGKEEAAPLRAGERAVLVFERGGARLPAAERWWKHETGEEVEVREGTVWVLSFDETRTTAEEVEDLALVRGRRHGLLCNPHSQDFRVAGESVPLPWLDRNDAPGVPSRSTRRRSAGPARSKR
jgi:hypothetical protein